MQILHLIATFLVIIGGLNWLSIGRWNYDFVQAQLGPMYANYVYDIIGLAAILLIAHKAMKYSATGNVEMAISA